MRCGFIAQGEINFLLKNNLALRRQQKWNIFFWVKFSYKIGGSQRILRRSWRCTIKKLVYVPYLEGTSAAKVFCNYKPPAAAVVVSRNPIAANSLVFREREIYFAGHCLWEKGLQSCCYKIVTFMNWLVALANKIQNQFLGN